MRHINMTNGCRNERKHGTRDLNFGVGIEARFEAFAMAAGQRATSDVHKESIPKDCDDSGMKKWLVLDDSLSPVGTLCHTISQVNQTMGPWCGTLTALVG